jgi:hypothetical protein
VAHAHFWCHLWLDFGEGVMDKPFFVLWLLFFSPSGFHQGAISAGWVNWYTFESEQECVEKGMKILLTHNIVHGKCQDYRKPAPIPLAHIIE